ncbi:MAG: zinc-binding dehydrogenase [Syntrophales bacterium]|jgi:(R,R)-butanediol dehydrogenase/meso-butanediol dehydrogenase/diacetyl reductase|nr:zinc-binding dehydrogenase [Syntrophales bacterium]MDY0043486.1 zinc-binding dehydrogenase [Syntrophales bacterium]
MKKAVYYGIRDVRVEDVEEPKAGKGEIKVKVKYCGICGSDLHEYLHGLFPESPFGHEVCGEVVETGPGVEGFKTGDHVATFIKDGYAEYLTAPIDKALKLPMDMDWKRAAVLEPLAGSIYALERGRVQPSDTVFIAGAGPVGLLILIALKTLGVETVYITDLSAKRRALAEKLGATASFDPASTKIPVKIRELTQGEGVDVTIEAVGIEATLKDCLASTKYRGTVIVQGIFTERALIHMLGFVTREMTMIGANHINAERSLEWLTNKDIAPESIVTSITPLENIVEGGFEMLANHKDEEIKILVEP